MHGKLWTTLALPAALLTPVTALADPTEGYQEFGPHMMWGGGWTGWVFGPVMMILVLAAIVAAVVLIARTVGHAAHGPTSPAVGRDPIDILKERFARGEIDKDEYEERRRVLGD